MPSARNDIAMAIRIVFSVVSFLASCVNILLIKSMGKWNGYLAIIWTMEICQLFYDCSFIFYDAYEFKAFWIGIQIFGGLSVSIWTNILSIVLLNVVVNTRAVDIIKWFYHFLAVSIFPSLFLGIAYISFNKSDRTDHKIFKLYFILRAISIALNFAVFALITTRANMMQSQASARTTAEAAIRVLSRRVVYYPVWQAITIIPALFYEHYYGVSNGIDVQTQDQFIAAVFYLILSPSAGIGYLIIFLIMQPNAYKHFVIYVNQTLAFLNCCCPKPNNEDKKVVVFGVIDNSITTGNVKPPQRLSARLANFFIGSSPIPIDQQSVQSDTIVTPNGSKDMTPRTFQEQASFLYGQMRNMEEDELIAEINKRTESNTSDSSVISNIHLHVDGTAGPMTTRGSLEVDRDSGYRGSAA